MTARGSGIMPSRAREQAVTASQFGFNTTLMHPSCLLRKVS